MNGFTDKKIIRAWAALPVASYPALFAWVVASINRLSTKSEALTIAVARLEGAVWGRAPSARKAEA